jgi:hypothetical protein
MLEVVLINRRRLAWEWEIRDQAAPSSATAPAKTMYTK